MTKPETTDKFAAIERCIENFVVDGDGHCHFCDALLQDVDDGKLEVTDHFDDCPLKEARAELSAARDREAKYRELLEAASNANITLDEHGARLASAIQDCTKMGGSE